MFNIIDYYKEYLSSFKIIGSNLTKIELSKIILVIVGTLIAMLYCIANAKLTYLFIMLIVEFIGLQIIAKFINNALEKDTFNRNKKKIRFGINTKALEEIRVNMIGEKLNSLNLLSNEKIEYVLATIDYEGYSQKYDYFLFKGFVVAIAVSIFNIVCNLNLKDLPSDKIKEFVGNTIGLFIVCAISIFYVEYFIKEIYEPITNKDEMLCRRLKKIVNIAMMNKNIM